MLALILTRVAFAIGYFEADVQGLEAVVRPAASNVRWMEQIIRHKSLFN